MPKLSARSLEKRFPCPHCNHTFRTRQGLSGHIQFKHQGNQALGIGTTVDFIKKAADLKKKYDLAGVSEEDGNAEAAIIARWGVILALCDVQGITPDSREFKTYFIMSQARRMENEALKNDRSRQIAKLEELVRAQALAISVYTKDPDHVKKVEDEIMRFRKTGGQM